MQEYEKIMQTAVTENYVWWSVSLQMNSMACHICGKSFATARTLKRHIDAHSGIYQYNNYCQYCQKGFNCPKDLKQHRPVHTNKNYFLCKLCHANYRYQTQLKLHIINEHQ